MKTGFSCLFSSRAVRLKHCLPKQNTHFNSVLMMALTTRGKKVICYEGRQYTIKRSAAEWKTWRCRDRQCNGTLRTTLNDENPTPQKVHIDTCVPDPAGAVLAESRGALRIAVTENPHRSVHTLYDEAAQHIARHGSPEVQVSCQMLGWEFYEDLTDTCLAMWCYGLLVLSF